VSPGCRKRPPADVGKRSLRLTEMKAGICVSTVSIVCIVTEACPIEHGPIKIEAIFVVADVIGRLRLF